MYSFLASSFTRGEVVPQRIGGSEAEFDIQLPGETKNPSGEMELLEPPLVTRAGIAAFKHGRTYWLNNGGNLHPDVNRVEYSSFEGDSAETLAAGNLAGMQIVRNLAAQEHGARLFRHSGTMVRQSFQSLGYHQNFAVPREAAIDLMANLWDTYQATQIWAWGGMIGLNGFELSQKARGVGAPTSYLMGQRTTEGAKPMGWIRLGDDDVFSPPTNAVSPWARIEGRVVDGGFSRWSAWMSEAVGSLLLRLVERRAVFNQRNTLECLRLEDPVDTLHAASQDLTLSKTYKTVDGRALTAIDLQELIADRGDFLRQRLLLPAAEYRAVDELYDICDRLRRTDIPSGDIAPIMGRVDFAPRLAYLLKLFKMRQLRSPNLDAVDRSLTWSRELPAGPGKKYWENVYAKGRAPDPIGNDLISYHVDRPPTTTRAAVRGFAVSDKKVKGHLEGIAWPCIGLKGRIIHLQPYDNDPSVLT